MKTKVEPTVEKWQRKFLNAGTKMGLGDLSMMIGTVSDILSHSLQEAKAEERERIQTEIALITARNANKQGTFTNIHIWANDIANFISALNTKEEK